MKTIDDAAREYGEWLYPYNEENARRAAECFKAGALWYRHKDNPEPKRELSVPVAYYHENIVITDPCYMKDSLPEMQRSTLYGDWSCMVYPGKKEENQDYKEWDEVYLRFWNDYNDTELPEAGRKNLAEDFRKFKDKWVNEKILGQFSADAGQVGIFLWSKLAEEDKKWAVEHPWCVAVVKDFTGNVNFVVEGRQVYVVGDGDKPFFSVQSGF